MPTYWHRMSLTLLDEAIRKNQLQQLNGYCSNDNPPNRARQFLQNQRRLELVTRPGH